MQRSFTNPASRAFAAPGPISLVELADAADPLFLAWLDLWETAFPPHERKLVSYYLRLMADKARGAEARHHVLAVVDTERQLLGMAHYTEVPELALGLLWYLAAAPEARNRGLGAEVYREIVRRLQAAGAQAMVFEVESPAEAGSLDARALAERRIGFYRRQGARLLHGVEYWQDIGPHQPRTKMHVMVHPFREMQAAEAFGLAQQLFEDNITLPGTLALE